MATASSSVEAESGSKKRALEDHGENDFGPSVPKRAKLEEDDSDDFGPSIASSSDPTRSSVVSSGNKTAWDRVRLEDEVGDVSAVDAMLQGSEREEWMTMLPSERKTTTELDYTKMQQSVTAFAKRGVQRRGDTSSWTDTPADRAARDAGDAKMSSLEMAKQLAAKRFQREAETEAARQAAAFNAVERPMSLYDMVKKGLVPTDPKESKKRRARDSGSDSDDSSSSNSSSASSSPRHKRSSHKHKKSKEKRDKHRHKDKKRDKRSDKKEKRKDTKSRAVDEQTPRSLSTADAHRSTGGYWDRERDLVSFGNRDSEQSRQQTFREAAMLNSRFYSGGTSTGPSNLR